jgi:tellurite methyltransferase
MSLDEWEQRYRSGNFPNAGPTPLLVRAVQHAVPGRALDLACGAGRNAAWLAARGWSVTAVDGSKTAIDMLKARAPAVDARAVDLEKHEFEIGESNWDLIAVCYYLQRDLFEPIQRGVKSGGLAVIIVHLADASQESSRYSMAPGELARSFEGWDVVHSYEGRPDDPEHARPVAEIVARRP